MKFHPVSPFSVFPIGHVLPPVRYTHWHIHVCLLLHVLLLVKPSHVPWNNRVCLLFHKFLLASLVKSSNVHRNNRSSLSHYPLSLAAPSDVLYWHSTLFYWPALLTMFLGSLLKKYLNPPSPIPFCFLNLNHPPLFRSLQSYLSPHIPKASPAPST